MRPQEEIERMEAEEVAEDQREWGESFQSVTSLRLTEKELRELFDEAVSLVNRIAPPLRQDGLR